MFLFFFVYKVVGVVLVWVMYFKNVREGKEGAREGEIGIV